MCMCKYFQKHRVEFIYQTVLVHMIRLVLCGYYKYTRTVTS